MPRILFKFLSLLRLNIIVTPGGLIPSICSFYFYYDMHIKLAVGALFTTRTRFDLVYGHPLNFNFLLVMVKSWSGLLTVQLDHPRIFFFLIHVCPM